MATNLKQFSLGNLCISCSKAVIIAVLTGKYNNVQCFIFYFWSPYLLLSSCIQEQATTEFGKPFDTGSRKRFWISRCRARGVLILFLLDRLHHTMTPNSMNQIDKISKVENHLSNGVPRFETISNDMFK